MMIRVCWWVPGRSQVLGEQFRVLPSDYRPRRDDFREFQVGRFPDFIDTSRQLFRRSSHYPFNVRFDLFSKFIICRLTNKLRNRSLKLLRKTLPEH